MTPGPEAPSKTAKRKKLAAAVAMMLIATIAICISFRRYQPPLVKRASHETYAYDAKTGQITVVTINGLALPSGLVRAHVFTEGKCSDGDQTWVGYLERLTPEASKALQDIKPGQPLNKAGIRAFAEGTQLSDPHTPDQWVSEASEEGVRLRNLAHEGHEGKTVVECLP